MQAAGQEVPRAAAGAFDEADERAVRNVRDVFGGSLSQATSGAAPIAKEILEFFYACGVPVLEGYGMTETSTVATISTLDDYRFGSVGRALPGAEIQIADDGEILIRGPNIFRGYYKHGRRDRVRRRSTDGWLHTGDLGSLDEDGYLYDHRPQEGHHHHRGRQEPHAREPRERPQALALDLPGGHVRRPAAVPGGADHARPRGDRALRARARPARGRRRARQRAEGRELVQGELDGVNANYAQVEQIKRFAILDHDLSQETGELTPTLKVKRNVVYEQYADLDALRGLTLCARVSPRRLPQQRAGRLLEDPPPGARLLALGGEVLHDLAHARGGDLDAVARGRPRAGRRSRWRA